MTAKEKKRKLRVIELLQKAADLADNLDLTLPNGAIAGALINGIAEALKEKNHEENRQTLTVGD